MPVFYHPNPTLPMLPTTATALWLLCFCIVTFFQQSGLDFVAWLLDIILALNIKSNICDLSIDTKYLEKL